MKPGAHIHKKGTDFAVYSDANRVQLLLFDTPDDNTPSRRLNMNRGKNALWHVNVPDAGDGTLYLYCTDAIPTQWLLDPYAQAVHFPRPWGDPNGLRPIRHLRTGRHFPKSVVAAKKFNWNGDRHPRTPLEETVIYEAHLRGFTRSEADGTYLDFIQKIPHLKELGVTAVEFLPLFEFNELEFFFEHSGRKNLLNFWGYSTIGFFAPMSRYAASRKPGAAIEEFKTLVKALHKAGIEVILDVVYNHTAEGSFDGQTYSFRGLDEAAYYMIDHSGNYPNWTGCGNTVNANHPLTRQFIVDSLKYWVTEMHVDGFRFDLATSLCRDENGKLLEKPPLIEAIEAEPALKHTKLIAEAWDLGAYQVGSYPGTRFCEWNGRYRDDVRRFWNDHISCADLATRLAGSSDLYEQNDRGPHAGINFVTAHDGFTLADLVTYGRKHNEANGEHNRDGDNHNWSTDFGSEGPSDDPVLNARRLKQQKNFLATLLLSRGIPMLTAGDEFGRTQQGNNNAYCQDNEIAWIDWSLPKTNRSLFEFTKALIRLRKNYPVLQKNEFYADEDVRWIGPDGKEVDWQHGRALGMYIRGRKKLLILINNENEERSFKLPRGKWKLKLSTDPDTKPGRPARNVAVPAHSLCIFC